MSPDVCTALITWAALVGALTGALTGWLACLYCLSSRQRRACWTEYLQRRRGSNPPPTGCKPAPPASPPHPDTLPRE
jgi:hypothetical protein